METETATAPATEIAPTPTEAAQDTTTEAVTPESVSAEPEVSPQEPPSISSFLDREDFDPYPVLDHPKFEPVFKREVERQAADRVAQIRQEADAQVKDWEATNAYRTLAGYYGNLIEKLEAGDMEGAGRVLERLEKTTEPFTQRVLVAQRDEGRIEQARDFFQTLRGRFDRRTQDRFDEMVDRKASWENLLDFLEEEGKKGRTHREEAERHKAVAEKAKAQARGEEGPNLAQGKTGAGRSEEEELMDPNTSIGRLQEIRNRRRAATR